MRRSTLAVVLLAGLVLAACAKKSSLFLDSGRPEGAKPATKTASGPPAAPAPAK
jgi:hypothetical protein